MKTTCFPMCKSRCEERLRYVKEILARGHIARFKHSLIPGEWKDVNDATIDEDGDMTGFRKSPDLRTLSLAWDSDQYIVEEIES